MKINLPDEKAHSNDEKIKELIKSRELMEDIGMLEGNPKRKDITSINEEIKKLKNSNYSLLK